jgi:hypothetical protein
MEPLALLLAAVCQPCHQRATAVRIHPYNSTTSNRSL